MRVIVMVACVLSLTACNKTTWIRADGASLHDPVHAHQMRMDQTMCDGETSRANMAGGPIYGSGLNAVNASIDRMADGIRVSQGCMASKGYVQVPEEQAEAQREEFARVAAEKQRREAAASTPVVARRAK